MRDVAEHAFHNAVSFHEAAIRSAKTVRDEGSGTSYILDVPEIVCTAFAAELYMKSLAIRRKVDLSKPIHELETLHDEKLNGEEQVALRRHYRTLRPGNDPDLDFHEGLGNISRAFVQWRYSHETPSTPDQTRLLNTGSLRAFAKALYLTIRELVPEWSVRDTTDQSIQDVETHHQEFTIRVGSDLHAADRLVKGLVHRALVANGQPQSLVIEGKEHNLSLTAPELNLHGQSPALNVTVRRGADPQNPRSGEPGK
jgi:hypothetical protein